MIVLPTESPRRIYRKPISKRLYLTDVGFFPMAKHHARIRKEGIEEYILLYCVEGCGHIWVKEKEYCLEKKSGILHSQWSTTSLLCL